MEAGTSLGDLLEQALDIRGITSAAVVGGDGRTIERASSDARVSSDESLITSGLALSAALTELLDGGATTQVVIAYERGPLLLTPLPKEGAQDFAGVFTLDAPILDDEAELSRVQHRLRELLPHIAKAVHS